MLGTLCAPGKLLGIDFSCHTADVPRFVCLRMSVVRDACVAVGQVLRRHPTTCLAQVPRENCRVNPDFVEGYCRIVTGLQSSAAAASALAQQIAEIMGGDVHSSVAEQTRLQCPGGEGVLASQGRPERSFPGAASQHCELL